MITLCIGAANRDPAQFANPNVLDLTRGPTRCQNQNVATRISSTDPPRTTTLGYQTLATSSCDGNTIMNFHVSSRLVTVVDDANVAS